MSRPPTLWMWIWMWGLLSLTVGACGKDTAGDDSPPDAAETGPRFYEDVAPILAQHCVSCHRDGGVAPFALVTYDDAVGAAPVMPAQVQSRQMPPWGADNSGSCNTSRDARWLSDAEIATIGEWATGARRMGDPAAAPPLPPRPPGLTRVDATAAMPVAYTADQTLKDDYRCFLVDPGIAT